MLIIMAKYNTNKTLPKLYFITKIKTKSLNSSFLITLYKMKPVSSSYKIVPFKGERFALWCYCVKNVLEDKTLWDTVTQEGMTAVCTIQALEVYYYQFVYIYI